MHSPRGSLKKAARTQRAASLADKALQDRIYCKGQWLLASTKPIVLSSKKTERPIRTRLYIATKSTFSSSRFLTGPAQ